MSYNISNFKVKRLENLSFPVNALYLNPRKNEIHGYVKDGHFVVTRIDCSGEDSGTVMMDMLEPAFIKSTGHLIALCVWEGGDSINRLEVHDGSISWTDIEI